MDADYGLDEIRNFLHEKEDAADDSDDASSVILGYQPVKQISKNDLLIMLESSKRRTATRRNEIVTPSKITSLLDEEDEDDDLTSESDENDATVATAGLLQSEDTPALKSDTLSNSSCPSVPRPDHTPHKEKKEVLQDIKNVCNNKGQSQLKLSPRKNSTHLVVMLENCLLFKGSSSSVMQEQLVKKNTSCLKPKLIIDEELPLKRTKKIQQKEKISHPMNSNGEIPLIMLKNNNLTSLVHIKQDSDEDVPLIKLKNSLRQLNKDVPLARLKKAVQQEISDEDVPLIKLKIPANQPDITPSADTKIPTKDDVPLAKLRRPIFTDHPLRVRGSSNPEECMDGTCGNKKGHSSSDDDCSSKQSNESEVERGSDGPGKNSGSDDGKEDDQDKKRNIKSPKDNASDEEMEEETEESNEVSSDESEGKLQKPKRVLKKKRVSPSSSLNSDSSEDESNSHEKFKRNISQRKSPGIKTKIFKSSKQKGNFRSEKLPVSKSRKLEDSDSEDDMPLKRQSNVANSESSSHSEDGRFNATGKQQISDSDDDKPIATLKKMSAKSCKDKKKEKTKKGPKVTSDEEIEDNMSSNDNSDQSERKLKKLTVKKRSPSVLLDSDSSDEDASFNMKSKGSLKKRKSPESKSKKNSPANKSKLSTSIPSKDKVTLCPKKSISRTLAQNDFDSEDDKPFKLLKRQSKSADSESTSDTDGGKDKSSKSAEPSKKPPVSGSQKGHKKMLAKGTNKDEGSSTSDSDSETENRKLKMKKSLSTNASSDSENDKPLEIKNKPQKKQNSSDSDDDKPLVALKKESGKTSKLMSNQDKKIEKLKRYLKEAGINFVPYKKISEQCNGNGKKIAEKLLSLLHEKGLKGTPSIEKCRKLKKKLELKKDRESLDLGNIIQDGATCIRRSQVTAKPMKRKAESSSDSEKEKAKKKYSRLLSLADNSSD